MIFDPKLTDHQLDRVSKIVSAQMIDGWMMPEPPKGFTQAVAFHYPDGDVRLDWTREPECDFASEYHDVSIQWPFKHDLKPTDQMWEFLGFMPLH